MRTVFNIGVAGVNKGDNKKRLIDKLIQKHPELTQRKGNIRVELVNTGFVDGYYRDPFAIKVLIPVGDKKYDLGWIPQKETNINGVDGITPNKFICTAMEKNMLESSRLTSCGIFTTDDGKVMYYAKLEIALRGEDE